MVGKYLIKFNNQMAKNRDAIEIECLNYYLMFANFMILTMKT